jgi:hypothetical protein
MKDAGAFKEKPYYPLRVIGLITLFLFISVGAGAVQAATYYVSNTTGDDFNNGLSPQSPWQHHPWMSQATGNAEGSALLPGDSVLLKRGDAWYDTLRVEETGEAGNLIVTGAYGSGSLPKIICPTKPITTGWTRVSGNIYRIQITHDGEDVGWVWQDEVSLDSALQMRSDPNAREGEFFFESIDATKGYLYVYKKGGGSPNGSTLYYSSKGYVISRLWAQNSNFIRFEYLELWGGNWATVYFHGGSLPTSNIELDQLVVRFSGGSDTLRNTFKTSWGIHFTDGSNISITNSRILDVACFGIHLYGVYDSIIANNNVGYISAGNGITNGGIKVVGGSGNEDPLNITIENNYVYTAMGPELSVGIWADVNARSVTIRYNKIYDVDTGIHIENGTSHNSAYYNIIENCNIGLKLGTYSPDNLGVFENEIYNNLIADSEVSFLLRHDDIGKHTIKNNISFNPTKYHVKWHKLHFNNGRLDIDYNSYFPKGDKSFCVFSGDESHIEERKTFEEWQALGYDPHSIVDDPKFKNPDVGDYHLLNGSPCIDKGINVGLTRDRERGLVPRGCCPDMGPFEYGSSKPGPAAPKSFRLKSDP